MKKAVFTKPFDENSPDELYLKSLLSEYGYDKEKIKKDMNAYRKGKKGEGNLNYYLMNTYADILCLYNVIIKSSHQKSQIDFVVIESDGIWVLESKSLSGVTTVDEDGKVTREKGATTRYPAVQAKIQANNLKTFLLEKGLITEDFPIKYRVVFTDNNSDSTVKFNQKSKLTEFVEVELISTLFEGDHESILSPDQMKAISDALISESRKHPDRYAKQSDYLQNKSPRRTQTTRGTRSKQPAQPVNLSNCKSKRSKKDERLIREIIVIITLLIFGYLYSKLNLSHLNPTTRPSYNRTPLQTTSVETTSSETTTNDKIDFSERKNAIKVSDKFKEVDGILLIPETYSQEDIVKLLSDSFSKYDYAKVTITTSQKLFNHYSTGASLTSAERISLENNFLIGEYTKNTCYQEKGGYNKNYVQFRQLNGKFTSLYGKFFDV